MSLFAMLAIMKLTHIANGQEKDYQLKQSGKKLHVGMKRTNEKQFFHGVTNPQILYMQTYWNHTFGVVQK